MYYAVRVRGNSLQVAQDDESADALYEGPEGLGVMDYLPAGCRLLGGLARRPGRVTYNAATGKCSGVGLPDVSPTPPAAPPIPGVTSLR